MSPTCRWVALATASAGSSSPHADATDQTDLEPTIANGAKFALTVGGTPTCELPAATISLSRVGTATGAAADESTYLLEADSGPEFDITDCTYHYNLATRPLGPGHYHVAVLIDGIEVGAAELELR